MSSHVSQTRAPITRMGKRQLAQQVIRSSALSVVHQVTQPRKEILKRQETLRDGGVPKHPLRDALGVTAHASTAVKSAVELRLNMYADEEEEEEFWGLTIKDGARPGARSWERA
eukprot:scaffold109692_cov30-Tisochrysis_lutea.AAC.1